MKQRLIFLFIFSLIFSQKPYLIMVSLDGFKWDYPEMTETPHLDKIENDGVRAKSLQPIFPSKTFPNHYSLATGMYADKNGLVANTFYDPDFDEWYSLRDTNAVRDAKWYGGEPIWVTAEKQNVKTASYFWVGSEAPIGEIQPTYFYTYDHNKPFDARVSQVIDWMNLPHSERPHLILLYFHEPDSKGHNFGPDSEKTMETVREMDDIIGDLRRKIGETSIADSVNLLVVSDHGMTELDTAKLIFIDDVIDKSQVRDLGWGPYSLLDVLDNVQIPKIKKTLETLDNCQVFLRDEIPERFHCRNQKRMLDILVLADLGWTITTHDGFSRFGIPIGMHGYDNFEIDMHGIFYAIGHSIQAGVKLETIENIQIYPLICEILGIVPNPEIDGKIEKTKMILK